MAFDSMVHELEVVRRRNQHPLAPHGFGGRGGSGATVQAIESVYRIYLPDYLYREYWVKRRTAYRIGDDIGVTEGTVCRWLKMLDLNRDTIVERAARHLRDDPDWQ
jgi:hypothetical protein